MPLAEGKGVELRVEAGSAVTVMADPRRLEQVFLNLLTNALKFTPAGGRVTADIQRRRHVGRRAGGGHRARHRPCVPAPRLRALSSSRQHDGAPCGRPGIGSVHRAPFRRGAGRDHTSSKRRARTRGDRRRQSAGRAGLGEASRTPANGRNAEDAGEPVDGGLLHGVRVLLVDDEPDAREMMAAVLETSGATVASAASATDALETLTGRDFDVVLADIAMPGQDGYQLIQSIRESSDARLARTPAAAVTACASDDERDRALAAGFQAHLAKPIRPAQLAQTVAALARLRGDTRLARPRLSRPDRRAPRSGSQLSTIIRIAEPQRMTC